MDKDRFEGLDAKVSGSVKEAVGKVTGDNKLEAEGIAQETAGTAQNTVVGIRDGVRDATRK